MKRIKLAFFGLGLSSLFGVFHLGCESLIARNQRANQLVAEAGSLRVAFTAPVDYLGEPRGPEADLIRAYARQLGIEIHWSPTPSPTKQLQRLLHGQVDLILDPLDSASPAAQRLSLGPVLSDSNYQVFCSRQTQLQEINELRSLQLLIPPTDLMDSRVISFLEREEISFQSFTGSTAEAFRKITEDRSICLLAEARSGERLARLFPSIEAKIKLPLTVSLSWFLQPERGGLQNSLTYWIRQAARSQQLHPDPRRYDFHYAALGDADRKLFARQVDRRLPRWRSRFEQAAQRTGLPWQLLAAVAYQESHWNPQAVSFTGVRGLMMLTLDTARFLGIKDRTDPDQSLDGGARYLNYLLRQQDPQIHGQDRLAFALASYNVGLGHLRDAQSIARKKGGNPHDWLVLRDHLPLLADPEYLPYLRHGPARGHEPVQYVDRIFHFYDYLKAWSS